MAAYLAASAFAMAGHEMWRDELHCWLVARDSETPWDVVRARAYDGQPPLWYGVLWGLTRLTWHPEAMQALHLAIAAANVAIVARLSPFTRTSRALFAFGYFTLYEYAAISRCYGLALLFALCLCVNHGNRERRPVATGLLLAALALTTTVGTLAAAGYAAALLFALVRRRAAAARDHRLVPTLVILAIAALGGGAAGLCAWPPADSTVAHIGSPPIMPWDFATSRVVAGLLPVPKLDFFFWNSNALLDALPGPEIRFGLAVTVFAWIVFVVSTDRFATILFGMGTALLVGLFSGVYSGSVRHHGFTYVLFVMAMWIATSRETDGLHSGERFRQRARQATLAFVLVVQVAGAVVAMAYDTRYVFSSGARAARILRAKGLADALLVAEVDYPATAVLGQLGPHAVAYSPRTGRPFSFVRWTRDRSRDPTDQETLQFAATLGRLHGADPVVIMNRPLLPELVDGDGVTPIAEVYDSMIEEENFYLYRVRRGTQP